MCKFKWPPLCSAGTANAICSTKQNALHCNGTSQEPRTAGTANAICSTKQNALHCNGTSQEPRTAGTKNAICSTKQNALHCNSTSQEPRTILLVTLPTAVSHSLGANTSTIYLPIIKPLHTCTLTHPTHKHVHTDIKIEKL